MTKYGESHGKSPEEIKAINNRLDRIERMDSALKKVKAQSYNPEPKAAAELERVMAIDKRSRRQLVKEPATIKTAMPTQKEMSAVRLRKLKIASEANAILQEEKFKEAKEAAQQLKNQNPDQEQGKTPRSGLG
jgi:hypothetical protein